MHSRRIGSAGIAVVFLLGALVTGGSASGEPSRAPLAPTGGPALHLIAADDQVLIQRRDESYTPMPLGIYIGSPDGDFELRARKADYLSPMTLEQWIDGGTTKVPLDPAMLQGFSGLKDFLHITITNQNAKVVGDETITFCPGSWTRQRINDDGQTRPRYPMNGCWENPFMLGNVLGIDEGWATSPIEDWQYGHTPFNLKDGTFTVHVEITPTYVDLFSVPPSADDATIMVEVTTRSRSHHAPVRTDAPDEQKRPSPYVPTTTNPDPSTVPDLVSLPAFGMWLSTRGRNNQREYLAFGANVWNRGPAPMVIEGFREPGEARMDAFQYFTDATGEQVARAEVGELDYDPRKGHDHWHLTQFARYDLLDANLQHVVASTKEAFCLYPTDAIDLTVDRADWMGGNESGLSTACGGPDAIWVREVLEAGWGDTYSQSRPGQSFRVSGLPNGEYFIQVTADPNGDLYETDDTNNVSLRQVFIKGKPGNRYLDVPPWNGIDTEG